MDEQSLDQTRERITRLFQFLEAFNQMRNPVVRTLEQSTLRPLWLDELPAHPSIVVGWDDPETDAILSVSRPPRRECPAPPLEILDWLRPGWREVDGVAEVEPSRPRREPLPVDGSPDGRDEIERFEEDPRRIDVLDRWLSVRAAWLETERPARQAMRVFETLYGLYGELQRDSQVEVVGGDGLLDWYVSPNRHLHPLVVQPLELSLEPDIPRLVLTASDRGPELYTALLRATGVVDGRVLTALLDEFEQGEYNAFSGESMDGFLTGLAARLHAHGEFTGPGAPPMRRDSPTIGRRPVIYTRKRNQGFAVALEAILNDIETRTDFPNSLLSIVGIEPPVSPPPMGADTLSLGPANEDPEILFTKPANEEQAEIARRLERYQAVMVQGPPGTGKTHTIANLIGHLLSEGKRVLVTAHTAKALERVREVIVDDLQPLAVSVVSNDLEGRAQLEQSVTEISRRLNDNADTLRRRAAQLHEQRRELLAQLDLTRRELLDAVSAETRPIEIDGDSQSPADAAREVRRGREVDDWIPGPTEDVPLPLTVQEVIELYQTNDAIAQADERFFQSEFPAPADFWTPADFRGLIALERDLTATERDYGAKAWAPDIRSASEAEFEALLSVVEQAGRTLAESAEWEWQVLEAGRRAGGYREPWNDLIGRIGLVAEEAEKAQPLLARRGPQLAESIPLPDLLGTLRSMQQHAARGGSFGRLNLMFKGDWARALHECSVAHGRTQDSEALDALVALAELKAARQELCSYWDRTVTAIAGPASATLGDEPEVVASQHVARLVRLLDWYPQTWIGVRDQLAVFGLQTNRLLESNDTPVGVHAELREIQVILRDRVPRALAARLHQLQLEATSAALADGARRLARYGGSAETGNPVRGLRLAVEARDPDTYAGEYERLVALHDRTSAARTRASLLSRLERIAPGWAATIRERRAPHDVAVVPGDVARAWRWRRLNSELDRRLALSPDDLQAKIDRLGRDLQTCTGQLVSARAWASQIEHTTFAQQTALKGWQEVMRKVGRGTGKRVPRLLAEARRLMGQSREAVPVWVMPLTRVVETFDFTSTQFDVVIIDEASQSDLLGLTALYLGKQVVIVGDNEQVSPDAVGQRLDDAQRLIDQFLANIPNREIYDGRASIYDLGGIAFTGSVQLREHFRCVPEIIQFSNDLSYNGKILPLRDASDVVLRPHVVPYRVPGVRAGGSTRAVNEAEAEFIASAIAAACEFEEYAESTFGVISLLGEEQARLIDAKLRQRLPPAQFERRKILAGTPPQFQGDERDVMFLSVVDSGSGDGPLAMRQDDALKKRYNVAASRAKDQLWVVHSLDIDRDLKPGDLRERLIRHALSPSRASAEVALATASAESPFEEAVGGALARLGYRVRPQHQVGAYRIDFVVSGADGRRVALECDGERWHTRDNLAQDLARQAQLERLGWRFVRIRGSEYYRDPDSALERLTERLEQFGIRPAGAGSELDDASVDDSELLKRLVEAISESSASEPEPRDEREVASPTDHPTVTETRSEPSGWSTSGSAIQRESSSFARDRQRSLDEVVSTPTTSSFSSVRPAEPTSTEPISHPAGRGASLAPYASWTPPQVVRDPREASSSYLSEMLTQVIAAEGPILAHRAYRIVNSAAGGQRLAKMARSALNRAVAHAVRSGVVLEDNPLGRPGQLEKVLRLPEMPAVIVRERGPRTIDEVPPNEIAELMRQLRDAGERQDEALKRRVLEHYDLKRLTIDVDRFLTECLRLSESPRNL